MQKDQLIMYATNHRGSAYNDVAVASAFLAVKQYYVYVDAGGGSILGYLKQQSINEIIGGIAALFFCLFMLIRQQDTYSRIVTGKFKETDCLGFALSVGFQKVCYLGPWLCLLFMPLDWGGELKYPGLIAYSFVIAATAGSASASAPVLSLLLFDILLPAGFALGATLYNTHAALVYPVGFGTLFFSCYAFIIGRKIHLSTLQLIESKNISRQSARRADDANRAKSSFLALMSHEIRTPMTGIFGMIDFLKETDLSIEQKDFVVTISDCSKTLLNTLNDILDFSKIESGKLAISRVNFDFPQLLNNAARVLRQIAVDKGLELFVEIDPSVPQRIYGDPHRLQQIIMNLVNNAVKFTENGSVTLKAFFMETEQPRLHIEIIDTGIGISKENMAKLFSAFSQADESIARKFGGSGLGLSIAKSLIKLMDGRIDVLSQEGKGSTFWFEIPYQPPAAGADAVDDRAAPDVAPQNILVTEDNAVNEKIITRLLSHKGHKVLVVGTGDAAIEAVQQQTFDLIFMDINMPGKNGIETTRLIRALGEKYRAIPIIGLSANIMEEQVRQCLDAGMIGHIGKPFAPRELYTAIADCVNRKNIPGTLPAPARPRARPKPASRTMAEVHAAIRDEMGPEYLRGMVESSVKESGRLMDNILKEFKVKNYAMIAAAAHDLKSVSGLIGMQRTSHISGVVEAACISGEVARLTESVTTLQQVRFQEAVEAEKAAAA